MPLYYYGSIVGQYYKQIISYIVTQSTAYKCVYILFDCTTILTHAAMMGICERTENKQSVVVQKTRICNYGQVHYKLPNALQGDNGYALTREFKNAIRILPTTYSVNAYKDFLDDWGTEVRIHDDCTNVLILCVNYFWFVQHIIESVSVGTRYINRSSVSYLEVYDFLSQQVSESFQVGNQNGIIILFHQIDLSGCFCWSELSRFQWLNFS